MLTVQKVNYYKTMLYIIMLNCISRIKNLEHIKLIMTTIVNTLLTY